jgi:hypothetical protein
VAARGEGAIRIRGLWVGGGGLVRDGVLLAPPTAYSQRLVVVDDRRAIGAFAYLRGHVWREVQADAQGIAWNRAGFYRPRYETRSELFIDTRWLNRFPSGNFGFKASLTHEYRSRTLFAGALGPLAAPDSRIVSMLIEIRILRGVASWQLRNLLGFPYEVVPGIQAPRVTNIYGVRWEFWN